MSPTEPAGGNTASDPVRRVLAMVAAAAAHGEERVYFVRPPIPRKDVGDRVRFVGGRGPMGEVVQTSGGKFVVAYPTAALLRWLAGKR